MAEPLFVRESIAEQARRLRRQADAYDELLSRRWRSAASRRRTSRQTSSFPAMTRC